MAENDGSSGTDPNGTGGTDPGSSSSGSDGAGSSGDGSSGSRTFTQEDVDRLIEDRLKRERKRYADYDDLKAKAKAADEAGKANQTLEEKLEALQREQAERDAAAVQEKADLAAERLHAKLVRGGLSDDDATALVGTIDSLRLLSDGKPDTDEIEKVAKTLTKIGTRASADPDQGKGGGGSPPSMNDMIRAAAGRTRVG